MRKGIIAILIVAILFMTGIAFADSSLKKLGRGTANVLTCPLEIFRSINKANKDDGPIAALTWGVAEGLYRTVRRAVAGIYEVVTFPIPLPREYKPIITDPEFFLEEGMF